MSLFSEQMAELEAVLASGRLSCYTASPSGHLGGPKVQELESLFCDYFHVKHAIAMNSATSCLHAACIAAEVKRAVVPVLTFSATASSVLMANGEILFTDIDPVTYNMRQQIRADLFPDLNCVISVHLHGNPCITNLEKKPGLFLIEDCAQALGASYKGKKVGTFGDCGVFSFNQNKIIQSGEGGMLITDRDDIAERARLLRNHGETQSFTPGFNYRLTELQAAVLIPQMKRLDEILNQTIELASYLTLQLVDGIFPPVVSQDSVHSYTTYPVKVGKNRDLLQAALQKRGIYFGKGGYKPLHLFPFYGGSEGQFPNAEECYKSVMYTNIIKPPMTMKDIKFIAKNIRECIWETSH